MGTLLIALEIGRTAAAADFDGTSLPGPDFPLLGTVQPRHAREIADSNWSVGGETLDRDFARFASYRDWLGPLGIKRIRFQCGWAKCERMPGAYDWAWLDEAVDGSLAQGVQPWLELNYGNPIYDGGGGTNLGAGLPSSIPALAAWDNWVGALVDRYRDRVSEWEVWNEPDGGRVNVEDYAEFYVRTAETIRSRQAGSKIFALALAGLGTNYLDGFLSRLQTAGRLHLVTAITAHGYPRNPDTAQAAYESLRRTIRKYSDTIGLRQGESGCPSTAATFGALRGQPWTETAQAKWNLRRLLGDLGHDIPSSVFTIIDLEYPTAWNTKGLLRANPDQSVAYAKPAYFAVQNLAAIFDSTLERIANLTHKTSANQPVRVFGYCKAGGSQTIVTAWFSGAIPSDTNAIATVDFTFDSVSFADPVWVDLRQGQVRAIPAANQIRTPTGSAFKAIPVYDSPILIAERSLIPISPVPRAAAWHPIELDFPGPHAHETQSSPNPFLDYRLQVVFTGPSGQTCNVPGFFDGDGMGGPRGNVWRVRFAADEEGIWRYRASFRNAPGAAINLDAPAGKPLPPDGASGTLAVISRDPNAPGYLKWGRLEYVGKHYLKFRDGPYWIRGGTDSPENLLAYAGFNRTPPSHRYAAHEEDWEPGDPDWGGGRGRSLIGALNYLSRAGANSIYFLTMNIGGDGQDVWPWAGTPNPKGSPTNDNVHFDIGKLRQWEIAFAHAQRKGLFLHFVFNEAEGPNKRELDNGELGSERKLYYREIVARFGHHLALQWNLCEEYDIVFNFGPDRIRAFADYLRAIDPYGHPITVHSAGNPVEQLRFTYGDPRFSMTSIQLNQRPIHEITEAIRSATAAAGRPLPISLDEFTLDRGQSASYVPVDDADGHRKEKLWPTYFSGGMIEFILDDLLQTESFKTPQRAALWRHVRIARQFMEELPFWEMAPADELAADGATIPLGIGEGKTVPLGPQVFAKPGEVYAVYLPKGAPSGTLDLSGLAGDAEQRWFNPRTGRFEGGRKPIRGGNRIALGPPPSAPEEDWVVLIR